jgi:hypothetical protein
MSIEEAIREYLAADAGVAALVEARVYLQQLPQSTAYPAIRVQLISEPKAYHLRGARRLMQSRIQIDAYDSEEAEDDYASAIDVAAAVDAALSGRRFTVGEGSPATRVVGAFRIARRAAFVAQELRQTGISQDFLVWSAA